MAHLLYNILPIPRRPIVTIHPDITVAQCCQLMQSHNIGALVVTDDDNLIGLVSERDIVRQCLCQNMDIQTATAAEIAYANVSILEVHDTVETAMQVITETRRRHLLVRELGQIVGLVSIGDLLYYMLDEKTRMIQHLEDYIHS